jgi:hypothetical protein
MELLYFKIFKIPGKQLKICNEDFNLHGKYHFSVDSITNEITLKTNENYINEFYGEKIKINSIVGKNGLGKTTLLKFFQYLICELNDKKNIYQYPFLWWSWCAIYSKDSKLYYSESIPDSLEKKRKRDKSIIEEFEFSQFYEQYEISSKVINFKIDDSILIPKISTSLFYSPFFEFEEPKTYPFDYIDVSNDILFYESKESKEVDEQTLSQTLNFRRDEIKRQIAFVELADKTLDESNQFYKEFVHRKISILFNGTTKKFHSEPRYISFDDIKFYNEFDTIYMNAMRSTRDYLRGKTVYDYEYFIARDSFFKRILEIIFYEFEYRSEPKEKKIGEYRPRIQKYNFNSEDYKKSLHVLFELFILNLDIGIDNNYLYELIKETLKYIKDLKSYDLNNDSFLFDIEKVKDFLKIEKKILSLITSKSDLPLFSFDWPNLSTGEKAYLNLFSRLSFGFEKIKTEPKFKNTDLLFILIDEGSTGFHPQWQKEFLKKLIIFSDIIIPIKKHFIITSHSPYLLSDLQIEDVISIGESDDYRFSLKNTFGANIHELLADKFYLENSFMGDFAREKIEEIGKVLIDEKNKPSKERLNEIEKIIKIIGEPILKERLDFLLSEKRGEKTKDEIILELKDEIKRLKIK